jgi:hypothetical protein
MRQECARVVSRDDLTRNLAKILSEGMRLALLFGSTARGTDWPGRLLARAVSAAFGTGRRWLSMTDAETCCASSACFATM